MIYKLDRRLYLVCYCIKFQSSIVLASYWSNTYHVIVKKSHSPVVERYKNIYCDCLLRFLLDNHLIIKIISAFSIG